MIDLKSILVDKSLPNPFSDSNVRSYSDNKLLSEFYPTSTFWSLFTDQHEVLLGTRGSGKSYLLKMMRYSLLLQIEDSRARRLVDDKNYLSLYVPMHLEYITHFLRSKNTEHENILLFTFGFNCLLAISLLDEVQAVYKQIYVDIDRAKETFKVAKYLDETWFGTSSTDIYDLISLKSKVRKLYYETDLDDIKKGGKARIFSSPICSPLTVVKEYISNSFGFKEEPTWIVCVDEAEFLNTTAQKCINNVFRSDSNRIAFKVATMHYKHSTLDTLAKDISVSIGNDFIYRVIDLKYDSEDFKKLSDSVCANRLNNRLNLDNIFTQLEDFIETIYVYENDNKSEHLIDYYRREFGEKESQSEKIKSDLIQQFSPKTQKSAVNSSNFRKAYYDKYLPVFIVRCMYKKSRNGNSIPGWYAGATMVRRLSQGNPRMYLELLNKLYEVSKVKQLRLKAQHKVLLQYSEDVIHSTEALPEVGPMIHSNLENVGRSMHVLTHGKFIKNIGSAFYIDFKDEMEFEESKKWLEAAIGFSKLIVDDDALVNGLKPGTRYMLSNVYSAMHWLPMRYGDAPTIDLSEGVNEVSNTENEAESYQLSLFD